MAKSYSFYHSRLIEANASRSRAAASKQVEAETESVPKSTQMSRFQINEEDKVKQYLTEKLILLQQQTDKRIAKAWIKGICPNKQAKFPYQNKQRMEATGLGPVRPEWWPPIDVCPFVEPDHIAKESKHMSSS